MKKSTLLILLALAISSTNAAATIDESEVMILAGKVTANLTALNIIGRSCYVQLEVNGVKGAQSKECTKLLDNAPPAMDKLQKDCAIIASKNVNSDCDNPGHYKYIMPTLNLINSLFGMK